MNDLPNSKWFYVYVLHSSWDWNDPLPIKCTITHSHICMWMEYWAENTKSSNSVPYNGFGILHSSKLLKYTYHIHFDIHALACIRTSILTLTHGPYTKRAQSTKQISFKFYVDRFWIGFKDFLFLIGRLVASSVADNTSLLNQVYFRLVHWMLDFAQHQLNTLISNTNRLWIPNKSKTFSAVSKIQICVQHLMCMR